MLYYWQGSVASSGDLVMISHPNNGTGFLPGDHDAARNHMTISFSRRGWEDEWKTWGAYLVYSGFSGCVVIISPLCAAYA